MNPTRWILERNGKRIRSFWVESEKFEVLFDTEKRSILIQELPEDTRVISLEAKKSKEKSNAELILLAQRNTDQGCLGFSLVEQNFRLRPASEGEVLDVVSNQDELSEEKDQFAMFQKRSAIAHAAAILLLLLIGGLAQWLKPKQETPPEPQLVRIVVPVKPVEKMSAPRPDNPSDKPIVQNSTRRENKSQKKMVTQTPQPLRNRSERAKTTAKPVPPQAQRSQAQLSRMGVLAQIRNQSASSVVPVIQVESRASSLPTASAAAKAKGSQVLQGGEQAQIAPSSGQTIQASSDSRRVQIVGSIHEAALSFSEEPTVQQGLDRDQIMAVINRHRGQIVFCYEKGLEQDSSLRGRLSVQFTIAPNGRVQVAQVAQSSLESKLVESCILSRLRGWQFPKPVGAVHVDVLYPFDLNRVAGG
jgi:hypothetical protein